MVSSPHDDGRATAVLLHLQHAFEMMLKAVLVQGGKNVFDKDMGRSIGFECTAVETGRFVFQAGDLPPMIPARIAVTPCNLVWDRMPPAKPQPML